MSELYSTNVSAVSAEMQGFIDQHSDVCSVTRRIPSSTRFPHPELAPEGARLKPAYYEVMSTDLEVLHDFIARFITKEV